MLAANAPLMTVYLLKDQLKELWFAPNTATARSRWAAWVAMAMKQGIAALSGLPGYIEGIVSSAVPVHEYWRA